MKKTLLIALTLVVVGAIAWYIARESEPTYYDPELDDFPVLYELLKTDERDCMKQKVGEDRVKILAEGGVMPETERAELATCIYY